MHDPYTYLDKPDKKMSCSHGEGCRGHPHLGDRAFKGREVTDPHVPMGHTYESASTLQQGDGFHHQGKSWVVKDVRDHNLGRTVVAEPRAGMVGRTVMSQLQFGTPGITMEDTEERAFTFHPDEVIRLRD